MKRLISLFSLFLSLICFSQDGELPSIKTQSTYIKGNALFLPALIFNAGVEHQLNDRYTLQGDFFISPWKSFAGKHAQVYMAGIEGRYYFNNAFSKFYIGANFSFAAFNIQKWTYWNNPDYKNPADETQVFDSKKYYQKGFTFIFGGTVGYQFHWKERWNVDLYLSVGSSQALYRGYDEDTGIRTDEFYSDVKRNWNKSGELIPYRGGVMISYKIK